ncbi:Scytalone dehydratase [Talaromyces proteolyticus]|uniref:Scytalone dehydratase n=1 Tax=Talaromyces proteolyticus TaxID=1131652 RepID=A0AAD4PZP0_9EURO|nr:Scytalone dehydratase [Talaromyces proteolyticus]KAH8696562.1 Scytalone dehydratase [Talaromyces proteolyticus]
MCTDIAHSDYLEIDNIAFEWARSYDTKDWERLRKCLSPSTHLDFRSLQGDLHKNLSPDAYVEILASAKYLGSKRLKTQHFLGSAKWERLDDGSVRVTHQIRVAHQRYTDDELSAVANKGHAHGVTTHWFRKFEGAWKIEGVAPQLDFAEYDLFGTLNPTDEES